MEPRKYLMRWRFDYLDKPSKVGMWSQSSKNPVDQAWNKNVNPSRVKVEVKDIETRETKVVVDCPGADFLNFQWMAIARTPGFFKGSITPIHQLVGLQMWTREKKIAVLDTGKIMMTDMTPEDLNTNFATFGK